MWFGLKSLQIQKSLSTFKLIFRYLVVECQEGRQTREGSMYLNVMRRFSHELMKVSLLHNNYLFLGSVHLLSYGCSWEVSRHERRVRVALGDS